MEAEATTTSAGFIAFTAGSGEPVVGPSAAAMAKVRAAMEVEAEEPAAASGGFAGFTTGSGKPIAGPSAAAMAKVRAAMEAEEPVTTAASGGFGGFTTGSGKPVAGPSAEAMVKARAAMETDELAGASGGFGEKPEGGPRFGGFFKVVSPPCVLASLHTSPLHT